MAERARLRWLLRVLTEPPFLRLYVENHGAPDCERRRFEDAFFSLSADLEHPEAEREPAWNLLARWLPVQSFAPAHGFRAVLASLCNDPEINGGALRDLARFWALPDLFPPAASATDETAPPEASAMERAYGYHELHCHLRGAVPYLHLWRSWLENERWRARLRREACRAGTWVRTWAELVQIAAESRQPLEGVLALGGPDEPRASIVRLSDLVRNAEDLSDEQLACAARYLAICAGLRRKLLHQRGRAGLGEFVSSYDKYSKFQKAPGRPPDELRALVRVILRRFEAEGAVAVELRPTLERTRVEIQRKLEAVIWGYCDYLATTAAERPVLMGLVPSLFKQEGIDDRSDIRAPATWQRQSDIWCAQVDALLSIIGEIPALRWFVVGLDAAGRERGCPPRSLAPALNRVRAYHDRHGLGTCRPGRLMAADWLQEIAREHSAAPDHALAALNERPITRVRLGLTIHAGEDFVDPMTGLRHIWECLEVLALGSGDRIGHALAAGLDGKLVRGLLERRSCEPGGDVQPVDERRFRLCKPRGEHLLDLAWMHWMCAHEPREQRIWAERMAAVAPGVLGAPVDVDQLVTALHEAAAPVSLLVPALHYAEVERLTPPEHVWLTIDEHWFEDFERLRKRVVNELCRRRIVVESCPTSNLAVAAMEERPPLDVFLEDGVRCVVATDDPGLLGAWPRDELVRAGTARPKMLEQAARASFVRGTR